MDIKVKQRLVGSVVLICLGILLLVVIFHGNTIPLKLSHLTPEKTQIPQKPKMEFIVTQDRSKLVEHNKIEIEKALAIPPVQPPQTEKKQVPTLETIDKKQQWGIQLASFSLINHAKRLKEHLEADQVASYIRKKGKYYHVIVGPFPSQQEAEKTQGKLKNMVKLSGVVIPFDGKR